MSSLGRMAASKFAAAAVAGDSSWSYVKSLLPMDGADGATAVTDAIAGKTWTFSGNAALSTSTKKWGSAALHTNTTGYISCANFGTDGVFTSTDFTVELWAKSKDVNGSTRVLLFMRGANTNYDSYIYNNVFSYGNFSASSIAMPYPADTNWHHLAVTKQGTTLSAYVDGARTGSATYSSNLYCSVLCEIGQYTPNNNLRWNGYVDDFRVTLGVARYTGATYTVPTAAFPTS